MNVRVDVCGVSDPNKMGVPYRTLMASDVMGDSSVRDWTARPVERSNRWRHRSRPALNTVEGEEGENATEVAAALCAPMNCAPRPRTPESHTKMEPVLHAAASRWRAVGWLEYWRDWIAPQGACVRISPTQ
eukprot:8901877-Pyramimonas_sp.AAC.1